MLDMIAARLVLRGLHHEIRPGEPLISLAELTVEQGRFVTISGPSGAGKSTLLYLLSGLQRPTRGEIHWGGAELTRMSGTARDRWRRQRAGFVFQDFHLIPEMSPLENVLVPAWFSALSAQRWRARAAELLDGFGVPLGRKVAALSRGEQQRVALARALLQSPAIIFADEPTASLDRESGMAVIATLQQLTRQEKRTVIAVSHDPALIKVADLRLRLTRGQKVELT